MSEPNRARAFHDDLITRNPDGSTEGRNPTDLSKELLHKAFDNTPLLKVMRAKCIDCCVGQLAEVRMCTAVSCPLWLFRLGKNPFSNRKGNPASLSNRSPQAANSQGPADGHSASNQSHLAEKPASRAGNSTGSGVNRGRPRAPQATAPRWRSQST
jgi:hypothetical protein